MAPALEPAFMPGRPVWPLAGKTLADFEPDDPDLAIPHGALQNGMREAPERQLPANQNDAVTHTASEPLAPRATRPLAVRSKWTMALAASCVFHAAVAAFFLLAPEEPVLIEGVTAAGIASLGDAAQDQVEAGDAENAVDVTMITVLDAVPVQVEAEAVPTERAAEEVEVAQAVTADRETLQPVENTPIEAMEPVEQVQEVPVEREAPVQPEAAPTQTVTETVPEVLATDRAELVDDDNFVQKPAEVQAAEPVEAAEAEPVEVAKEKPEGTRPVEAIKPVAEREPEAKQAEKKPPPTKEKASEKPAARPKKAEGEKKVAEKGEAKPKKSGENGRSQASARRGASDGQEKGDNRQASRGGSKNGEVGNAAVSNYPGKVRSKLVRVARSVRAKGRGEVVVAFAVSSNGGVRSARVARSSGDAAVDQAALQAVRKAAPFPPIPDGAGRSTWEFSVPLAFRR